MCIRDSPRSPIKISCIMYPMSVGRYIQAKRQDLYESTHRRTIFYKKDYCELKDVLCSSVV